MKKKYTLLKYCILMMFVISFLSLNSCSKVDEEKKAETETETLTLSAEKGKYSPYEIVTISAPENVFTSQSFTAKINNIEIIISSNENVASFVLPNLSNGNYDLSFTLNEKKYIVPISVSSLSNVLSADQYFNEIKSGMTQKINDLNSQIIQLEQNSTNASEYTNLKNDVIKYTNLLNDYTNSYNKLSVIDKIEFAKTMAANKASIDEYNQLTNALNSSTKSLKKANSVEDYEKIVGNSSQAFVVSVIYTVGHVPFILAGTKLAATTLNPGVIIACGILTGSFLVNTAITISAAISLTSKSIKPFEFISQTNQTIYDTGIETVSDIQAKYRSLIYLDANNSENGGAIHTIVEKYNYFKEKYNGFISELPAIFRPSYSMTSLKNSFNSSARSIYNQYVSITNVSNPNVTLQQLNQSDGSIKIKAITTATTDQTFTYDVNYTNNNFTKGLKKTVEAKVLVVTDSTAIYKAAVVGNWTMTWHDPGPVANNQIDKFLFNADGTGTYYWMQCSGCPFGQSIDPGNAVYRITWSIRKVSIGVWFLDIKYPDRGWASSTQIFLSPGIHSGVPITSGLYFLGVKD